MPEDFKYDVFLSHSAKDKAVVRLLAERLREDGLKVWFDEWEIGQAQPASASELQPSAFSLQPFPPAPLNKERRFIPLRLDDAHQTCFGTCRQPRLHRQSRI
jgi:hypothetical protein